MLKRKGFTMVELLLVIIVIAAISSFTALKMSAQTEDNKADEVAKEIATIVTLISATNETQFVGALRDDGAGPCFDANLLGMIGNTGVNFESCLGAGYQTVATINSDATTSGSALIGVAGITSHLVSKSAGAKVKIGIKGTSSSKYNLYVDARGFPSYDSVPGSPDTHASRLRTRLSALLKNAIMEKTGMVAVLQDSQTLGKYIYEIGVK